MPKVKHVVGKDAQADIPDQFASASEYIAHLVAENNSFMETIHRQKLEKDELKAHVEALSAPVTEEEFEEECDTYALLDSHGRVDLNASGSIVRVDAIRLSALNRILAARAQSAAQSPLSAMFPASEGEAEALQRAADKVAIHQSREAQLAAVESALTMRDNEQAAHCTCGYDTRTNERDHDTKCPVHNRPKVTQWPGPERAFCPGCDHGVVAGNVCEICKGTGYEPVPTEGGQP